MSKTQLTVVAAISLIGALATSQARAQSASTDAEIAALKQQLRLMEQKLDKLQKQTAANTAAAARASAKADTKISVANSNAAYPVKGPVAPSDAVVKMPNNRPTICTAKCGLRLIRRHCAGKSVLIDRRLGRMGDRRPLQHHQSQRPTGRGDRRRRRATDHLYAGAELVRQPQRPLHVRLPSRQRCQAGEPDQFRRCGLQVRCIRNADPGGVLGDLANPVQEQPRLLLLPFRKRKPDWHLPKLRRSDN
jgi:hypothetical protein